MFTPKWVELEEGGAGAGAAVAGDANGVITHLISAAYNYGPAACTSIQTSWK